MENILLVELPAFHPKYRKWKKYGYKNAKEKEQLRCVLDESTNGYCMYCYSRIRVDGKLFGDLEHAIEKKNSEKLIECIPNIGLTCRTCNQIFKKAGENKRKLPQVTIEKYESESACTREKRKQCTVPCKALKKLQKEYSSLPGGEIILQPSGMKGGDSGEELALQYDVLKLEFQPACDYHAYSAREKVFIDRHIKRFRLNDPKYRTHQLYEFVRNIVDHDGKIPEYEYNNRIVAEFRKKLENKSQEEVLKICKKIFLATFLRE